VARRRLTANQVVALNLRTARGNLTQGQAAQQLRPYLGKLWSKASFSVAEQSANKGARVREFDANEVLAFSLAFGKTIAFFYEPPDDVDVICGDPVDAKSVSPKQIQAAVLGGGVKGAMRQKQLGAIEKQLRAIDEANEAISKATEALKYLEEE
jgi:hypothetical protein